MSFYAPSKLHPVDPVPVETAGFNIATFSRFILIYEMLKCFFFRNFEKIMFYFCIGITAIEVEQEFVVICTDLNGTASASEMFSGFQ